MTLSARIEGIGLVGPGWASWDAAREVLSGGSAYAPRATVIPAPEALPAVERRRAGKCVRLALAAGMAAAQAAGRPAKDMASIFASSSGDGENLHAICEALASDDRLISPTRFHNSVHNAPAGYWGIATGATQPSDCIAAFDASFAAGLLEAGVRLKADPATPVLLIAYDAPYPEPLLAARPLVESFAVALALSARGTADEVAVPGVSMRLVQGEATRMADARLEALRSGIPAARALPLLECIATARAAPVRLEYLQGLCLEVSLAP